ncbi:hypothetical protein ANCCEY_09763 [Ancylostoma ceylanicum]|uniref:Uncharacterized protein n=1 Tax=Ancylostoma ceylanicum TaxID=53326 RepID=A0A0D6LU32_9BILA|nr:hypothetical protein ANCCEY_09763 [Ancylostoma ceylanicum]
MSSDDSELDRKDFLKNFNLDKNRSYGRGREVTGNRSFLSKLRSIKHQEDLRTEDDRSGLGIHISVTSTSNLRKVHGRSRRDLALLLAPHDVTKSGHKADFNGKNLPKAWPWANAHSGNRCWTRQQDGASAHKARVVQNWCKANFSNFISFGGVTANSPDLNPIDDSV